jgi:thiamine pyrophosphate-dependent acetolactate synthase large subunit-like protein
LTTVREAAFELFGEHGMTTIFGNPGSTELLSPLYNHRDDS